MLTAKHYQQRDMSLTEYHTIGDNKYMVTYTAGVPMTHIYRNLANDECEKVFTGTEEECRNYLAKENVI